MKNLIKFIIFIGILAFLILYIYPNYLSSNNRRISKLGYSSDSIKKINDLEIEEYILNNKYSKVLDNILSDDDYDENYFEDYFENKYFKIESLERYIKYDEKTDYSKDKVVIYVNINLDKDFYTDIRKIDNPNDTLALVNKYYALPDDFEAKNLITFSDKYSYNSQKMNEIAAENMMKLIDDARSAGYTLTIVSGYRTESYQKNLYDTSVKNNGKDHADKYSARPGHSEHQTGLTADISNKAGVLNGFEKFPVYNWVKENAHKYGFIERYPKGKEFITGYSYEPWHYRYVGVKAATTIYEEDITFEEYVVKYLNY